MPGSRIALVSVLAFIALLYLGFRLAGFPAGLFCTAFAGGFVLWIATTYGTPIDAHAIIASHLLTVVFFIIHVYEEFWSHIETVMTRLTGLNVTQQDFLTIAAFIAPILWLAGAILALKGWQFGYFLVSVFYFGMMFGEPSHFLFPFILDGRFHYVAGMYTAALPSLAGWFAFLVMRREIKRIKHGDMAMA